MLPVIIWSPLEQYSNLISNECPKCENCVSRLSPSAWTNGQSTAENQPRLLHCVNFNVLLVSRIYCCENNHRVLGHHPGIIKQFNGRLRCVVPFHLWHQTGFTVPLLEYVANQCNSGVSLRCIERALTHNRLQLFVKLKEKFEILCPNSLSSNVFPEFESESLKYWRQSPQHHTICAVYLQQFGALESTYHYHMCTMSVISNSQDSWLSCDHTFRSVRSIGIMRQGDNKWINQLKGLFCVLNACGQVVTWKMTKGIAMEHVEDIMHALCRRLQCQGVTLQEFYVDNCCSLRAKLQAFFGSQLKVHLDIFHAVQRITKKIPKRHPFHSECIKCLSMVFRDPSDRGSTRTMSTPAPDVLESQMLSFKSSWDKIKHNDKPILPPAAVREIQSLLVHVRRGCLSGILPGRGTTKNERLHRELNSLMANCRYGVEFSYALLTSALFQHNEDIAATIDKRSSKPIFSYKLTEENDCSSFTEPFGLTAKQGNEQNEPPSESTKALMKTLQYQQVLECLTQLTTEELASFDDSTTVPDFTSDDSLLLFVQAISSFYVANSLQEMSKTAEVQMKDIFFTSFLTLTKGFMNSQSTAPTGSPNSLDEVLSSWSFRRVEVLGDGNCLFTSVAHSLVRLVNDGEQPIITQLLHIGIPEECLCNITYIRRHLRIRMVQEWNSNIEYYQGFITEDLALVSQSFLDDTHFSGAAGDLMVLTLANVLQLPINIFMSVSNMPLVCILPTNNSLISTSPLCLAYTQDNADTPGHYDYVVPMDMSTQPAPVKRMKIHRCTCGRKQGTTALPCSTLRCNCYRDKLGCSNSCTCKNCGNQHGQRPVASGKRQRKSYDEQKHPTRGKPGREFLLEMGEETVIGRLSVFEILLLKAIVIHFLTVGIDVSPENVHCTYMLIYTLSLKCPSIEFPLYPRELAGIRRFMSILTQTFELFAQFFN